MDCLLAELETREEHSPSDSAECEKEECKFRTNAHRQQRLGRMLPNHRDLCAITPLRNEHSHEDLREHLRLEVELFLGFFSRATIRLLVPFNNTVLGSFFLARCNNVT